MHSIFVSGSLAYDHIMNFPGLFRERFLHDKLHNINVSFAVDTHAQQFGGTAGNIAYTLALLGEKPIIAAAAGGDFDAYRKHLETIGLSTNPIETQEEPTAAAFIVTDQANNQISAFSRGAMAKAYSAQIPEVTHAIIAPGCLDDMRSFPGLFREKRIPFYFDPGQSISSLTAEELQNGIEGAEAVFMNDYENAMVAQKTGWGESDIVHRAKLLIVTLGASGSRLKTKDGETHVNAVPVRELKDPTGAGDAYRAGFLKGVVLGLSAEQSARIASTAAAYCVESLGTQNHHFSIEEFKDRYQAAYNETSAL